MSFHGCDLYPWFPCGSFFAAISFCGMRDRRAVFTPDAFSFLIIDSRGGWQLAPGKPSSSASTCPQALFQELSRSAVEWIETHKKSCRARQG
jgi:hypothetical protein